MRRNKPKEFMNNQPSQKNSVPTNAQTFIPGTYRPDKRVRLRHRPKWPWIAALVCMLAVAGIIALNSVNGQKMKVSDIIHKLNELGGKHGIGIIDIVENRVVGMKSRGVYETPGGTILMEAHQQLEELILDRDTYAMKKEMGSRFASLVYEGKWFTPLRQAEQAFIEETQKYVTGEVKFKLYKGNIIKAGTTSPYTLYNEKIASFTTGDLYDHHDAEGFINLFGLSCKVRAMKLKEQGVDLLDL